MLEGVGRQTCHRVCDHTGLGALDEVNLRRLLVDRQIAMEHPNPALASHSNSHSRLGHGVHGAGNEGHAHGDIAGHP